MNMNIIFAGNVKLTWLGSYSCTAVYPTVLCIDLLIGRIATQVLNNKRAQCIFVLGVVAEWSKVLIPVPCLPNYGVIHISLGHISAQVHILGVSCHLFIYTFHFTLHFGWPVPLERSAYHIICIYLIFGLQIIY